MDHDRTLQRELQSLLSGGGAGTSIQLTGLTEINNLKSYLLSELPYGEIAPVALNPGIVQWSGVHHLEPEDSDWVAITTNGSIYPYIVHWQFGRKMYPILKAIRIQYSYAQPPSEPMAGSLLIGYQAPSINTFSRDTIDRLQKKWDAVAKEKWDEDAGHWVSAARLSVATVNEDKGLTSALHKVLFNATLLEPQSYNRPPDQDIGELVRKLSPYPNQESFEGRMVSVEKTGLARDNDSLQPFQDTWPSVANDLTRYQQLLHWPFGAIPYRITKAIRVQLPDTEKVADARKAGEPPDEPLLPPALFFGYQGPIHPAY